MSVKRYADLSSSELAELTDDQIQHYIDVEIAYAGIIPCEKPVLDTVPEISIEKKESALKCRGILFVKEEDAVAFSKMETLDEGYDNKAGFNYKFLVPSPYYGKSIEPASFYSREDVILLAAQLEKAKRIESENKSKSKEWESYQNNISSIESEVYNAVRDAKGEIEEINKAKRAYQKHLSLSGGNKDIAEKFFRDAYKDFGEEWISKVINEE